MLSPFVALLLVGVASPLEDTLDKMPRYDRYEKLRREIGGSVKRGTLSVTWSEDSKSFFFNRDGKPVQYILASKSEVDPAPVPATENRTRSRGNPERGRQFDTAFSPDGKQKVFHRTNNLYLSDADGKNEVAISTDGNAAERIKYGIASWVYGEELEVREAMWWSPDSQHVAYYRFDEKPVKDYYLALDQSKFQATLDVEAYPKAGTPNPIVGLLIYDKAKKISIPVDTKFGDATLGEYVYDVRWSPDGKELFFNRTNRKQNIMEFCAADPATGKSRAIVRESQLQSWAENHPYVGFLPDNNRFLWMSERNGYRNLYLMDRTGKLINAVTRYNFDVERVVKMDAQSVWYTARSAENPYLMQLHRVGLDGKNDRRLTDPQFSHSVTLSPDGKYFVDVAQTVSDAPSTRLVDENGRVLATLATSDTSKFEELQLKKVERFTYTAADGKTKLFGTLHYPSDFDPSKKYPLVVSVYAGPESSGSAETFQTPNPITEMGFLHASFDGRGTSGRGKAFRDAVYGKLGVVEIDDQAAGVRALSQRPFVDGRRVGIYGTSYGGYASTMALLRHPDVFHVACASSSVTDWRHYDTIYTERFQGLPWENENKEGYDAGSALTYVKNLKGKLMLYFGTADNNVHPSNTLQLVDALEKAGKRYDMQVGPDRGHTGMNSTRMWEYFVTHLILKAPADPLKLVYRPR